MTEMQGWLGLVLNAGLPTVLVLYYILVDRPRQQKREDEREEKNQLYIASLLAAREKECNETRALDRQHSMEMAKVTAEVHKLVSSELKMGLDSVLKSTSDNRDRINALYDKMNLFDSTLRKFTRQESDSK